MRTTPSLAVQRRRFGIAIPLAVLLCAVFAVLLTHLVPLSVRQAASSVGLLTAGLLGIFTCSLRAAQTSGRRRRSWSLIVAAGVVAVAGNSWVAIIGADPVDSPSVIGESSIILALLLSIAGLMSFPSVRRRGIDLMLMTLDGIVAAGAVLVMASVLVYSELLDATNGDLMARWSTLSLPALDVLLATVSVLLLLRGSGADRPALALVAAGFIMYAIADLAFSVLAEQDNFDFGTPLDLGWIVGYILIGLAALYPSDVSDSPETHVGTGVSDARGTVMVFGILLTAAVVQVAFGDSEHLQAAQAVLWLVLILAAGTRQTLLAADNAALRRGLERRVREQTADLRRLARQTEVLLTSVGDGIYGVDHDGRVTFVNPSGAAALGYAAHELLGHNAHEKFHAPGPDGTPYPSTGCYVADAIRDGLVANAEEDVYVRADGGTVPVEITASPVIDEEELRGAVVVFRDVTQRREVDRMKNEFLSVVSHELRTPLTSIRGSLGLLAGGTLGELTPRADSMVTIALQSSERLTRLINDLLDMERIESGTRPMEVAALDASHLCAAAAKQIDGLATSVGVRVALGTCEGRVLADEDRIMQTLTNLLGNAIKYSDAGEVVTMDAAEEEGHVVFRVLDQGRGIPADKLESIFERFEQVDSSDARQKGGTGLGLAISRSIVERHGGRIWAESEVGSGTTVLFTLPSARRGAAAVADAPRQGPAGVGSVLLVEDDEDLARVIITLLGDRGLDVTHAATATEALALGRRHRPHVIILDLHLPDGSGAGVVSEFRGGALADTALVVYSSADVERERRGELELGTTLFLTKGRVGPEELRDRVLELVQAKAIDTKDVPRD
jgi:PAS domain S-box-containing protein